MTLSFCPSVLLSFTSVISQSRSAPSFSSAYPKDTFVRTSFSSTSEIKPINQETEKIINAIAETIFTYRRPMRGEENTPELKATCCKVIADQVRPFVLQNKPIQFAIPAFPFKSPSSRKCIGALPDMAERLSLEYFKSLTDKINKTYARAKINIFADGRAFSNVVGGVCDQTVCDYLKKTRRFINDIGANDSIEVISLEDVHQGGFDECRQWLIEKYGEPIEQLKARVKSDPALNHDYVGIKKFVFEDLVGRGSEISRSQLQKQSADISYGILQATAAWSKLIKDQMPEHVRISCHPQPADSPKVGVWLGESLDNWLTPWHGVAVCLGDGKYTLMRRQQAEAIGFVLVNDDEDHPSHFEFPKNINPETKVEMLRKVGEMAGSITQGKEA